MMQFGDFGKLTNAVNVANKVVAENPVTEACEYNYLPGANNNIMEAQATPAAQPRRAVTASELDASFDELFGAISSLNEGIETPAPRPAVSQKDFVSNATSAQKTGDFTDAKKQTLPTQNNADLVSMKASDNGQLAKRGKEFKEFLVENFAGSGAVDSKIINDINHAFDLIVLRKLN